MASLAAYLKHRYSSKRTPDQIKDQLANLESDGHLPGSRPFTCRSVVSGSARHFVPSDIFWLLSSPPCGGRIVPGPPALTSLRDRWSPRPKRGDDWRRSAGACLHVTDHTDKTRLKTACARHVCLNYGRSASCSAR